MKYVDIKEFREKGYLQELNRLFLHPLGMALEVSSDNDGNWEIKGIQDHRDDTIRFGLEDTDSERIKLFKERSTRIAVERYNHVRKRRDAGTVITRGTEHISGPLL